MLKINLSEGKGPGKAGATEESSVENSGEQTAQASPDSTEPEKITDVSGKEKKKSFIGMPALVVLLIVVVLGAVAYYKTDTIVSLFVSKPEVVVPVQPPPPPPPPAPAAEPDPVFFALNKVSDVVPPKVWLTSVVIMNDGTYDIQGIAFSHASINDFITGLGSLGSITGKTLPERSRSSETVYKFIVSGVMSGISVPEILDVIPTDDLVALATPVADRSKEFGVRFSGTPRTGTSYTDKDLPFKLAGTYGGLKQVVGALCPEDSPIRVYRMVIVPEAAGHPFDTVKASFSLRTISKI